MRIAAIPIATADLGSDGGVIDGCARVHWRGRAMFPAAGDGSGNSYCGLCGPDQKEGDLRVKLVSLSLGRGSFGAGPLARRVLGDTDPRAPPARGRQP